MLSRSDLLTLLTINFIVVTKGAERISEVSARFTLDAMPGKQMAIDADLNAGLINQTQAQTRRKDVASEADFYGAMDGASKFVRGDAIAGMMILAINLIGGVCIGIFKYNLSADDSADIVTAWTGIPVQNAGGLPDVPRYLLNRLGEAESLLRLFLLEVPTRILYIDYDADGQPTFCAASSRVPQLLRSALWNTREPAILTSGTLAAAGDFSHTEQLLGLAAYRPLRHFRADSPFNYKKKCLLYFPPRVKTRMDNRKMAEEIVRLVDACHGHALVLFTSYRQMAEVRALTDGQWQYPTYIPKILHKVGNKSDIMQFSFKSAFTPAPYRYKGTTGRLVCRK